MSFWLNMELSWITTQSFAVITISTIILKKFWSVMECFKKTLSEAQMGNKKRLKKTKFSPIKLTTTEIQSYKKKLLLALTLFTHLELRCQSKNQQSQFSVQVLFLTLLMKLSFACMKVKMEANCLWVEVGKFFQINI